MTGGFLLILDKRGGGGQYGALLGKSNRAKNSAWNVSFIMLIYFIIGFNKYDGFGLYLYIFHLYTLYIIFYAFFLSIYNDGVKSLRKVKKQRGIVYNR